MRKKKQFYVVSGKGKRKKHSEAIFRVLLFTAVGLLLLQATYSLARDALAGMLVKTVISEDSVLEQLISVSGVLVRDEYVVAAPVSGVIRWNMTEGNRVAVGTGVASIHTENGGVHLLKSPVPGVLVYKLDGLEGELQPNALATIEMSQLRKRSVKEHIIADGKDVSQGTMLYKIVNNYDWHFVAELTLRDFQSLDERKNSRLRFTFSPEEEIVATWKVVGEGEDTVTLAFTLKEDVEGCFSRRFAEAEIIVSRFTGLVLPSSALVLRGEEAGVYVIDKSVVRYLPVNVVETAGEQVVVEGVRTGFTVVTNPSLLREGQRL